MSTQPIPLRVFSGPVVDKNGHLTADFQKWLTQWIAIPLPKVITPAGQSTIPGQIKSGAVIQGRTEGVGTTVTNITPAGKLNSLGNVVDTSTDHLTDGTGNPLTGGKRGFQALDTNNRLVGTFRSNGVNVSAVPGASTNLSNNGVATSISVGSFSNQFGDGLVSYNSGSVDPGLFGGPYYVYADDPTYAGGSVTWQASLTQTNQSAANGRILAGSITTVNGTSKTGGGTTGGTGGGRGGRQYT